MTNARRFGLHPGFLLVLAVLLLMPWRAYAAGLLIADGGMGGVLQIEAHDVEVSINNAIAVTRVTQVFRNTENRQVEALYTFPVPKGASVANFSMWIHGKEMIGEVLEKQHARRIYNRYKRVRRDPGLLEQKDYKAFEMRIFPIAARATQKVQICYYQELDFDHDAATYVYPLASTTRAKVDPLVKGKFSLRVDVRSEIPIVCMTSPSHEKAFQFVGHGENYWQASLEASDGRLDRDVVLGFEVSRPRTGLDLIASRTQGEDGYFCLTMTVGEDLESQATSMDYVFLLDISGSMAKGSKLARSQASIAVFLDVLDAKDRLDVITFNAEPKSLLGRLVAATSEIKDKVKAFLDSREPKGGTELRAAIRQAYRYAAGRPLNVVLLSDGLTEPEERSELLKAIQERPKETRVFCVGIGNEVNRSLLEQVAGDAGGLALFISPEDDLAYQACAFRRKLLYPVATDLAITFDGGGAYDVEPHVIPNLYHGMPVRLYGRYRDPGFTKITVAATVRGHRIRKTGSMKLPEEDATNPEVERMWAWHRIDRLLKDADRSQARAGVRDEIVRLGEAYSIATEYTSFIVLENDAEYERWRIERRNVLRLERDREAQRARRQSLMAMRDKVAEDLGPVMARPQSVPALPEAPDTPHMRTPRTEDEPGPRPRSDFGADIPLGFGGALDPFSAAIMSGLGALAYAARRRRRRE